MNRRINRKTAPGVKGGKVQKKNRQAFTARLGWVIDRESPAAGHRHVVTKRDIRDFIGIIPDWADVAVLIQHILLSAGGPDEDFEGEYEYFDRERTGIIRLPAWEEDLWINLSPDYFEEHRHIYDRLGVAYEKAEDGWQCRFTKTQARAYTLMHIFLHELGHHVDRLRRKNKDRTTGGEHFAEQYANEWFKKLWPEYVRVFGKP